MFVSNKRNAYKPPCQTLDEIIMEIYKIGEQSGKKSKQRCEEREHREEKYVAHSIIHTYVTEMERNANIHTTEKEKSI